MWTWVPFEKGAAECASVSAHVNIFIFLTTNSQMKASKASYVLKENRMHSIFTRDYFIASFCLEEPFILSRLNK